MPAKKKWTIIFLVSAKSNLYYEMITAINEMYTVGSSAQVNFILIYDGLAAGKFKQEFAQPSVYKVEKELPFLLAMPDKIFNGYNLTDESHLTEILQYAKQRFPAEKFGFVYKGHGKSGGTQIESGKLIEKVIAIPPDIVKQGNDAINTYLNNYYKKVEYADNFELKRRGVKVINNTVLALFRSKNRVTLTHKILNQSLKNVFPKKNSLSFIFMDCCWAMQIENVMTYVNTTENYIASADEMPAVGVGYIDFCERIVKRPAINEDEIAQMLVSVFFKNMYDDYDSDDPLFLKMGVSLTAADLKPDYITPFKNNFIAFCKHVTANMDELYLPLTQARKNCYDFTYYPEEDYGMYNIDLMWFLENLHLYNAAYTKDTKLAEMIKTLLLQLSLNLRKAYLGSNYKDAAIDKKLRVCRGITISFPRNGKWLNDDTTMIGNNRRAEVPFYTETGWPTLLEKYYKTVKLKVKAIKKNRLADKDRLDTFLKKYASSSFRGSRGDSPLTDDVLTKYFDDASTSAAPKKWGNFIDNKF